MKAVSLSHTVCFLSAFYWMLVSGNISAAPELFESHDPLRGVTFYSAQVSTDRLEKMQTQLGVFSGKDLMTVGISVFVFDESDTVDEYLLWLRHDGPKRWFVANLDSPLAIVADDRVIKLTPLHVSRADKERETGPFVEKLEFSISPEQFQLLKNAKRVTLELLTGLGTVEKALTDKELELISRFNDSVYIRMKNKAS